MRKKNNVRGIQAEQPFEIDLEAVPGAGYMWELVSPPDEIELLRQEVVSIPDAIGGNATQRFHLVSHRSGNYSLLFALKRRWEKDSMRTSKIQIQVK